MQKIRTTCKTVTLRCFFSDGEGEKYKVAAQISLEGPCGWLKKQSLPPVGRVVGHLPRGEGGPVCSRDSVSGWSVHCQLSVWEGCKDYRWRLYWEASLRGLWEQVVTTEKRRQVCALVSSLCTIRGIKAGLMQMVIQRGPFACFIKNSFDLFFGQINMKSMH